MLAVRLEQYGVTPVVAEVPEPVLQRDDDVIVAVQGAGVCRTDLHAVHGELAHVFRPRCPSPWGTRWRAS